MTTYGNLSLKRKLQIMMMLTAGAALALACFALLAYDRSSLRSAMRNDLAILADIIGENSTAALSFNDPQAAEEILNGLRAKPHLVAARIFGPNGQPFATYQMAGQAAKMPDLPGPEGHAFGRDRLTLFHRISLSGPPLGPLYLQSDLGDVSTRLERYAGIVALVVLCSSILAFVL